MRSGQLQVGLAGASFQPQSIGFHPAGKSKMGKSEQRAFCFGGPF